ncbi:sirohydrochlorin chelatase [Sporolactobacillus shoreicorticis]|uniref:Sirohydrochlorin chelatase n=1 Tax=Sporolactobacillus shoreicorticis TaxID=1923877 RepID=A0ABW5RYJ0_9BACL|nr:sirohydrochlorin chelatase [Sporolactobacillus shoreicorticis]MCO7125184.1 sirohydrochlorin chelatase [Sporolactobacillus shoreicorticis]
MQAIMYVAHGSRVAEGVHQVNQFLEKCMDQINVPIQKISYLELVRPTILEGISHCVDLGADCIVVQPILLLSAGHDKRDIPGIIDKARKIFPNVRFIYGQPFGVDSCIIDILFERLREQQTGSERVEDVLVVGRGSSYPEIPQAFAQIRSMLMKRGIHHVSVCYMAAARPLLKEGLEQASKHLSGKLYILPYLLFSGILMKSMKRIIAAKDNRSSLVLCRSIGYHPLLIRLLKKRIEESMSYDRLPTQS